MSRGIVKLTHARKQMLLLQVCKTFFQQPIAIEDKLYCGQKVPDPFQHICPEGVYILILGWGSSISFHAMTCSGKAPELSQERVSFLG